jgi:hypothetical protein
MESPRRWSGVGSVKGRPVSDPTREQANQPSEEEMRAYLEQLRDADPAEIVAQAYTMLGTGAEVKLGRSDARVLIDAMGALAEAAQGRLGDDLVTRMRNGVVQLQTAQVQAERQAAGDGGTAQAPQAEAPQQPSGSPSQPPPPAPGAGHEDTGGGQPRTDRLWIPGREPR